MCCRYHNLQSWHDLRISLFSVFDALDQPPLNLEAMPQVRPTNAAPIVMQVDGELLVKPARWWLVPWFHRGALKDWKAATFNARAETVRTLHAYRGGFARRRCLVPADGWYEWMGPRDDQLGKKQPWLFTVRDAAPMMFAGIWDRCDTTDQGVVESFTIVTQPAGATLNAYHYHAPVVLFKDDWARWLDLDAEVDDLLVGQSADRFEVNRCAI